MVKHLHWRPVSKVCIEADSQGESVHRGRPLPIWSSDPGLVRASTIQCWQRTVEVQAQIAFRTNVQFSSGARPHSSHTVLPFSAHTSPSPFRGMLLSHSFGATMRMVSCSFGMTTSLGALYFGMSTRLLNHSFGKTTAPAVQSRAMVYVRLSWRAPRTALVGLSSQRVDRHCVAEFGRATDRIATSRLRWGFRLTAYCSSMYVACPSFIPHGPAELRALKGLSLSLSIKKKKSKL